MQELHNNILLNNVFLKYNLTEENKEEFFYIIKPIFYHEEFQKRLTNEYLHHDKITLGEHILEVAIVTYVLAKKKKKSKNLNINTAVIIAMFHDLYTIPWQNNELGKTKKFCNKHGFRHPIEAVINSSIWFKDYYLDEIESKKIIDGIIHHMYPFPVIRFYDNQDNNLELKNYELTYKIDQRIKLLLINLSNSNKIGKISFKLTSFKEGKLVCLADKYVTFNNLKNTNINSFVALVTGKNKSLKNDN